MSKPDPNFRSVIEYKLEIVGHCPSCGGPIYGRKTVGEKEETFVRYSCQCQRRFGIEQTCEKK